MNSFNFIKNRFLKLTSKTYPYGTEDELVESMQKEKIFPKLEKDAWGNYFYKIGKSRTIFASHLDTACKEQVKVNHVISKQQIITTDGTSILGADDKAGITILLWLIENKVPGLYYFFIGEEVGCIGSGDVALWGGLEGNYDRIISFDRRGTNSVITYQSSYRCCSDKFAESLAKQLNKTKNLFYKKDDGGVYTDSAEFIDQIPECTNLSVGYMKEHTASESQDLYHLNKLANACLEVDWENLPTKRNPKVKESKWGYYGYSSKHQRRKTRRSKKKKSYESYESYGHTEAMINSRTFYDSAGDLVEIEKKDVKGKDGIYKAVKERFLTTDLTLNELEIIKEQSFNMKLKEDKEIYETLSQLL